MPRQAKELDKGKEKLIDDSSEDGEGDAEEEEDNWDEELRALLKDIPQFDGADDEPVQQRPADYPPRKRIGVDPKRSVHTHLL